MWACRYTPPYQRSRWWPQLERFARETGWRVVSEFQANAMRERRIPPAHAGYVPMPLPIYAPHHRSVFYLARQVVEACPRVRCSECGARYDGWRLSRTDQHEWKSIGRRVWCGYRCAGRHWARLHEQVDRLRELRGMLAGARKALKAPSSRCSA